MSTEAPTSPTSHTPKSPETKFGPFAGGLSVAIWKNTLETEDGPREIRSITISPRRYKDADSGEWRIGSYRPSDVSTLVLALQAAQQFMISYPLSRPVEEEPPETAEDQETPF